MDGVRTLLESQLAPDEGAGYHMISGVADQGFAGTNNVLPHETALWQERSQQWRATLGTTP
jgi:hypothetical protein